jgi:hypothetical protein
LPLNQKFIDNIRATTKSEGAKNKDTLVAGEAKTVAAAALNFNPKIFQHSDNYSFLIRIPYDLVLIQVVSQN